LKVFRNTPEKAEMSKVLAANQGLYNGFLAAGLVWGLVADELAVKVFFLVCVIVAGVYGAMTVNRRILLVQAVPALLALVATYAA
jgi:putative membrane protein